MQFQSSTNTMIHRGEKGAMVPHSQMGVKYKATFKHAVLGDFIESKAQACSFCFSPCCILELIF
jgi:hypothetical protein